MKKKIIKIVITVLVVVALIGVATWMAMPAETYHLYLHENIFEREAYCDDNTATELPFEVMLTGIKRVEKEGADSAYCFSLLMQPCGNRDPRAIESFELEPLQTESYRHFNFYIEEFAFNEKEGRMQVFLCVEKRRYQLVLSRIDR